MDEVTGTNDGTAGPGDSSGAAGMGTDTASAAGAAGTAPVEAGSTVAGETGGTAGAAAAGGGDTGAGGTGGPDTSAGSTGSDSAGSDSTGSGSASSAVGEAAGTGDAGSGSAGAPSESGVTGTAEGTGNAGADEGGGPAAAGTTGSHNGSPYTVYAAMVRSGGTVAWRNNNPGNIRPSQFTTDHGAIGKGFGFAIFPDEATGRSAIVALLQTATYQALTIKDAIFKYAPPNDNNDSAAYVAFIKKQTGLDPATPMAKLTEANLNSVAGAIGKMEGWTAGQEYSCGSADLPTWAKTILGCT